VNDEYWYSYNLKVKNKKKKSACMEAQYLNISQSMLNEIMDKWNFLTVPFLKQFIEVVEN
jgi:hypothetical protein